MIELLTVDLPKGGKVIIMDDSYNADILSIYSELNGLRAESSAYKGKKICVLGPIINMEQNRDRIYKQIIKPLIDLGMKHIFVYGGQESILSEVIPRDLVSGSFSDIDACARAVADILEPDDYILLKGSRKDSDFGRILPCVLNAIDDFEENVPVESQSECKISEHVYGIKAIDVESGEVLYTEGNPCASIDRGIGGAVLLFLLIKSISYGKIKLNDYVTIGSIPSEDSKSTGSIGLQEGEKVSVHTLLSAMICQDAPDAASALAEKLAGTPDEALKSIKDLAIKLGLGRNSVENVTGRLLRSKPQSADLNDLVKLGLYMFSFPTGFLKVLNTTTFVYNGRLFSLSSNLIESGKAYGGYLFGKNNGEGIILSYIKGRKTAFCVCGARDSFHRDHLLARAIDRLTFSHEEIESVSAREKMNIEKEKDVRINIIGDTYFGEDYTKKRQKKGMEDSITKYGYDYSFKGIESLLKLGDLNIANFEAALTDLNVSPLHNIKPYVLGGNIEKTTSALKKFNIKAVTLANNHAMDYGVRGLYSTLKAFEDAGIQTIGAGYNSKDANEPMRVQIGDNEIIIFSVYWYRESAHHIFELYALGNKPGVACLSGELMERIEEEKRRSPDSLVITIVHWGSDFQKVLPLQRTYAKQLLDSGTDLIIGHGAHMMQEIQQMLGKWVIYSIGNGVFNSDGEYDARKVPPYSFFVQLVFTEGKAKSILLYPLFSNNLETFWQTHPVTQDQFKEVINYQNQLGTPIDRLRIGTDAFGNYIEIPLT